jgi:hypothetical protein
MRASLGNMVRKKDRSKLKNISPLQLTCWAICFCF